VAGVEDGVASNEITHTCCKQQFNTAVTSDARTSRMNADCASAASFDAVADSVDRFELQSKSKCQMHSPDKGHLSDVDVKVQQCDDQMMVSWQRSRSLKVALLGIIVRIFLSSDIISQYIQVTCLMCFVCCYSRCKVYLEK